MPSFPFSGGRKDGVCGMERNRVGAGREGGLLLLLLLLIIRKNTSIGDPIRILPLRQINNPMPGRSRIDRRGGIILPLTQWFLAFQQAILVQADGEDHVGGVGHGADLVGGVLVDVAVAHHHSGGLVAVDQGGEDADAVEWIFFVMAHVADSQVDGGPGLAHGLCAEHFLGALVGERVGVQADAVVGAEDGARGVLFVGQVGDGVEGEAAVGAGDGGVVLDQVALLSSGGAAVGAMALFGRSVARFFGGRGFGNGAVAEPEEVPVVAVRGLGGLRIVWLGRIGGEEAAAPSEVDELVFEPDVPVGIVFDDEGRGEAIFDDAVEATMLSDELLQRVIDVRSGKVHMCAPRSYCTVAGLLVLLRLMSDLGSVEVSTLGRTLKPSSEGSDLSGTVAPSMPGATSALKPVREEETTKASSRSPRSGRLRT